MSESPVAAQPFFLEARVERRFCLYHAPAPGRPCRGALVYVHPFAEEMNKSRRMAALAARRLAGEGVAVLQVDLHGCGDSSGDFAEVRWETWLEDIALARDWLERRAGMRAGLWGLRLGALLALDFARLDGKRLERLVLWQPVTGGATFLTQFLRLRLAQDMLGVGDGERKGTDALRQSLLGGETLEIAGYELAPELAAAIDGCDAASLVPGGIPVDWFEVVPEAGRPMPPGRRRVADGWLERDVDLRVHLVTGLPFWGTQEIAECGQLVEATVSVCKEAESPLSRRGKGSYS